MFNGTGGLIGPFRDCFVGVELKCLELSDGIWGDLCPFYTL